MLDANVFNGVSQDGKRTIVVGMKLAARHTIQISATGFNIPE